MNESIRDRDIDLLLECQRMKTSDISATSQPMENSNWILNWFLRKTFAETNSVNVKF